MVSKSLLKKKLFNTPTKKILLTLLFIIIYRIGNIIPLTGVDQEALKKAFFQADNKNTLMQVINMYSGGAGSNSILTFFSLGIIPYINASILVDLLTAFLPSLEKLQQEEGDSGRRQIKYYKKILSIIFATIQSSIIIGYIKPYMYNVESFSSFFMISELLCGSMLVIWLTDQIDNNGIGNGQSLFILLNIVGTLVGKGEIEKFQSNSPLDIGFLCVISFLILLTQIARIKLPIVSARQLSFVKEIDKVNPVLQVDRNDSIATNNLTLKFNQAGIFPIIIASNISPILSYFLGANFPKFLVSIFYYFLIVIFNYFYTTIFWDPDKISENLRKTSVSLRNVEPGIETVKYLNRMVAGTSIAGGLVLCGILLLYEVIKQVTQSTLLNQLNISSLMIVIGVTYELQRSIAALYQNLRLNED